MYVTTILLPRPYSVLQAKIDWLAFMLHPYLPSSYPATFRISKPQSIGQVRFNPLFVSFMVSLFLVSSYWITWLAKLSASPDLKRRDRSLWCVQSQGPPHSKPCYLSALYEPDPSISLRRLAPCYRAGNSACISGHSCVLAPVLIINMRRVEYDPFPGWRPPAREHAIACKAQGAQENRRGTSVPSVQWCGTA